ncbi:hypothetical protein [Coxiella-like endosymbiont of Rhipicephalus sanguineus]|uniref:hypothetical protein n=1 Tax=Coxiella-like endosymbiont of Rhipicephalus sanguineus TaxID=1955402 RepID=UPI00203C779E|nr:hypothetical protein [Coxiella-like endosymbiont of Rhipicephalus sanguineus]
MLTLCIRLKRYRLKTQHDDIADSQNPFDISVGQYCYIQYQHADTEQKKRKWLIWANFFGDYLWYGSAQYERLKNIQKSYTRK